MGRLDDESRMKSRSLVITGLLTVAVCTIATSSGSQQPSGFSQSPEAPAHVEHAQQEPESTQVELLDLGEHYRELTRDLKSGEQWLALDAEDSRLHECRIEVKNMGEEAEDDPEDTTRLQTITTNLQRAPMILVRGGGLTAGPIVTVFKSDWSEILEEKTRLEFAVGSARYELKVVKSEDTATCEQPGLPMNARLVLSSGESRQVLYSLVDCGPDAGWYLNWAGDLDRDGKLDLLMSLGQGMYDSAQKLFLSSKAGKGRLVKEVAELRSGGC